MSIQVTIDGLDYDVDVTMIDSPSDIDPETYMALRGLKGDKGEKGEKGDPAPVVTLADVATSGSYNDLSNKPTIPESVEKSATTPKMDGTASVGTETKFAAGDHVHPSDSTKVDKETGKGLSTNDYTTAEKDKLGEIEAGAEVNQNAFSTVRVQTGSTVVALEADSKTDAVTFVSGTNITLTPSQQDDKVTVSTNAQPNQNAFSHVKVGSAKISADTVQDTLELIAGSNITLSPDSTNDEVTISATDTTYSSGTSTELSNGTVTSTRVWTPKILHDYVAGAIQTAVTGAVAYQGVAPTTFAPTNYTAGWYWIVGTAGTYCDQVCEAGDMIFCKTAGTTYSASDFDVVQTNLDITSITNSEIDTIVAS